MYVGPGGIKMILDNAGMRNLPRREGARCKTRRNLVLSSMQVIGIIKCLFYSCSYNNNMTNYRG